MTDKRAEHAERILGLALDFAEAFLQGRALIVIEKSTSDVYPPATIIRLQVAAPDSEAIG